MHDASRPSHKAPPQHRKKRREASHDQQRTTNRLLEQKVKLSLRTTPPQTTGSTEQIPGWLQVTKTKVEILAYLFAFIFFVYKTYEGYLTTNLSLSLLCKRCAVPASDGKASQDYLAVIVTIKKGENGLMKLKQAELQITAPGLKAPLQDTLDLRRLNYDRSKVLKGEKGAIDWTKAKEGWPFLQFPPGDGSQFASSFLVPAGEPCRVELVVMGKGRWPKIRTSQWRASDISLPKCDQSEGKKATEKNGMNIFAWAASDPIQSGQ